MMLKCSLLVILLKLIVTTMSLNANLHKNITNTTKKTNLTKLANTTKDTKKTNATKPTKDTKKTNATKPTKDTKKTNATKPTKDTKKTNATKPTKPTKKTNATKPTKDTNAGWPEICRKGKNQSPINLPGYKKAPKKGSKNDIIITGSDYNLINGVSLEMDKSSNLMLNLKGLGNLYVKKNGIKYAYVIKNISFHFESEHLVNGVPKNIEMHLLHVKNDNYTKKANKIKKDPDEKHKYLIVAILFEETGATANPLIEQLNFASKEPVKSVDLKPLVDKRKHFYYYSGSLTTPGCDEAVNWVVMEEIEKISIKQADSIRKLD